MNDLNCFFKDVLTEVRKRLSEGNKPDDDKALDIIIDAVFSDERSRLFSHDDLDRGIRTVFLKTRKRLGILQPLIEDNAVTEIMVNGPDRIFVEKNGEIKRYALSFDSEEEIEEIMRNIAGDVHREISEMNPIVDARLPDGSRVSCVYKNVAVNGPVLTIRKFSENCMKMKDLVANGTVTEEGALLLEKLTECGYSIFVSGGTSSGKTTLLNALSEAVPADERVIVIEDSMELKLSSVDNIVHMECRSSNASGKGRVTMAQLIKSSLRMRPDRIIVGEVRGAEVADMLQAMNTGHCGMSTGHGNSVKGMLRRLESMYLMASSTDIDSVRGQIAEGIDIMVHIEKISGGVRRIVEITEIAGYERGEFILNVLMTTDLDGRLIRTGNKLVKTRNIYSGSEENACLLRKYGFI